jgi:hypothetical protein
MGLEGLYYGFRLRKMKFLNIPRIFAGFVLLERCLPATCCTEWVQEDERRARFVNPAEKKGCSR